jgi:dihydrodipicolinate synthase/N-acetylneuraminate lyase
MTPAAVLAVWNGLTPLEKQSLIESLVSLVQGKPPKPVRISALRTRRIAALAKVAERLK